MSVLNENTIIGASGAAGEYEIEQSLRFNDDDGSYLSRTPSSAGNRKTWTYSGWIKRGDINASAGGINHMLLDTVSGDGIAIRAGSNAAKMEIAYGGGTAEAVTNQLFRDFSAWYHIIVSVDSTQSTNTNRIKIYVNGEQVTSFASLSYPSQNADGHINNTVSHQIGKQVNLTRYFDGYMAEVNFIDGQALTPDSFGETGTYGEWKPTKYTGTYGTNGFYLPFEQDYTVEGFSTVVYEGTRQNQYIGGTGFKPDLVWMKTRSATSNSVLIDSVRGGDKALQSSTTSSESQYGSQNDKITAFNNDGFTLGVDAAGYGLNNDGVNTVAWNWDMGGTTASNTNGSITSSVRANTTYGQSIVSYSGTGSNATVGHGLASAPEVVILKNRDDATKNWNSIFTVLGTNYIDLNRTNATYTGSTYFQNTAPSSTVFSVGTAGSSNASSQDFVAYCFHSVTGYSKFGSYSGNGSTTGPVVTLGFTPAFVMYKNADATTSWRMHDSVRGDDFFVYADQSAAEGSADQIQFTSTGFKIVSTSSTINTSGQTYIYMAFADTREYAYWYDQSGNNNDWTSEGGLTESDVMLDSPTNNFAVCESLQNRVTYGMPNLTEGNLKFTSAGLSSSWGYRASNIEMPSGKWYAEYLCSGNNSCMIGVMNTGYYNESSYLDQNPQDNAGSFVMNMDGATATYFKYNGGTQQDDSIAQWNDDDIVGIAIDADAGTAKFYVNGSLQTGITSGGTVDISAGSGDAFRFWALIPNGNPTVFTANFGQDSSFAGAKTPQGNQDSNGIGDFYYAPPTGFLALCTANLPDATVIPSEHFNTVLYTGNDSTNVITGVGFKSDLSWWKKRNVAADHALVDSVRGVTKHLVSNTTTAEITANTGTELVSFDSDGFTLGAAAQTNSINGASASIVAWNWKAGGSASSNTNGTITSQVSANPSAGFSIVSYTGTGANATVGHGLSVAPNMTWIKPRNFADNWIVTYDSVDGSDDQAYLNLTNAGGSPATQYAVAQNATTLGLTNWNNVNDANDTYIAYCFHSVDGYSKVGSYTGNGSADGPFVHCGFRPAFVLTKVTNAVDDWSIADYARSPDNVAGESLRPNSSSAEDSAADIDILSNGFKVRQGNSHRINYSGDTYIFIAFAENPFKHTNAR